ncbi:MAG TPA: response regulator, partial [Nitrososphaeraceae archaeon]|nr:response regulator [Nitrososphaeraceae archaeon]
KLIYDIIGNKNNRYILLVDYDKDIVFTFDMYLKSIGYTIVSFVNHVEALYYFNKYFADCSLIITDYGMPQMSGIDLIKKIREKDEDYKIKSYLLVQLLKLIFL